MYTYFVFPLSIHKHKNWVLNSKKKYIYIYKYILILVQLGLLILQIDICEFLFEFFSNIKPMQKKPSFYFVFVLYNTE